MKTLIIIGAMCMLLSAQEAGLEENKTGSGTYLQENVSGSAWDDPAGIQYKSISKALLYSLVLPGAGEFYLGHPSYAKSFFAAEVSLWLGLWLNDQYYHHLRDEYIAYAADHAGLSTPMDFDKQFLIDIGKYDDVYAFNEKRSNQRYFDELYDETSQYWNWDSKDNRYTYDRMRIDATMVSNQKIYFYTAVVLNHLVSGINAMRLARRDNREMKRNGLGLHFEALGSGQNWHGLAVHLNFPLEMQK